MKIKDLIKYLETLKQDAKLVRNFTSQDMNANIECSSTELVLKEKYPNIYEIEWTNFFIGYYKG